MEADSTTFEKNAMTIDEPHLPFSTVPGNFNLYKEFVADNGDKILEIQVVERMQNFGLLPNCIKCPSNKPDCKVTSKVARVVDRVQWICDSCGKRQPIRESSFFLRLQCSIVQALQIILAWCEDADLNVAAEHFGVKPKVTSHIYDKLDELAVKEYDKHRLGGENSVVLAEMYPDCTNRLSPDTTDHPHVHRILMLADTNHIPTYYRLHVIKENHKKANIANNDESLRTQVEEIISKSVIPGSMLVTGHNMLPIDGAASIQQLTEHCDGDMKHFLSNRIWRQALSLCAASRDVCPRVPPAACGPRVPAAACGPRVERYLHASLYRLRFGDGFYRHILAKLADEFTRNDHSKPAVEL